MHQLDVLKYVRKDEKKTGKIKKKKGKKTVPTSSIRYYNKYHISLKTIVTLIKEQQLSSSEESDHWGDEQEACVDVVQQLGHLHPGSLRHSGHEAAGDLAVCQL